MRFQKIIVAIDNSPLSHSVFTAALELAQSYKSTVMLLHSLTTETVGEQVAPMTLDAGLQLGVVNNDYQTQQFLVERRLEEAQTLLKDYCEEAMRYGVPAESDCKVGEAGHQLCEVAGDWGADLVVVGREGRTGIAEALLGSVSNYVVHHAPCSVLVIQEVELEPPATSDPDMIVSSD